MSDHNKLSKTEERFRDSGPSSSSSSVAPTSRRDFLKTGSAGAGAVVLGSSALAGHSAASSHTTVEVSVADEQIDVGDTTWVEVRINEIPQDFLAVTGDLVVDSGTAQHTIDVELDVVTKIWSGVEWNSDWGLMLPRDVAVTDLNDNPAYFEETYLSDNRGRLTMSVNNSDDSGNMVIGAGETDVLIGRYEIEGVADGETDVSFELDEFVDFDNEPLTADVDDATLQVGEVGGGEAPDAPSSVSASSAGTSSIDVSWSGVSAADQYNVYVDGVLETTTSTTSTTVTGLDPDTTYEIGVAAENTDGESGQTTDSATTDAQSTGGEGLRVDLDTGTIDAGGSTQADLILGEAPNGVVYFNVDVSVESAVAEIGDSSYGSSFAVTGDADSDGAGHVNLRAVDLDNEVGAGASEVHLATVTLDGVGEGATEVDVSVDELTDNDGNLIAADVETATLNVGEIQEEPEAPSMVSATPTGSSSVDVEWSDVAAATQYNVYVDGTLEEETSSPSTSITGLEPETTYTIGVSAENDIGESDMTTDTVTTDSEQTGDGDVLVSFADDTIQAGSTTELSFELDEVPETGVNGVTLEIDLDGSVAELTGSSSLNDAEWQYTTLDMAYSSEAEGDDSMAVVSVNNADGSIDPGATNVSLGSVEVQGVGAGSTDANVTIDSYQDQLEQEVDATVGSDSLTVEDGPGGEGDVQVSFADDTIQAGSTTDLSFELDEVPETGVNGVTLEIDLDGSVAELTGSASLNDAEWQYTTLDMAYSSEAEGDDSMAVVSVNNADGSIDPGATNVSLGSVEVQGVGAGTTGANVTIDSYQDQLEQEVDATVGSDSLTVEDGPGGEGDVQVSFQDSTIQTGGTTELSFELDEVPETGVNGVTLEIDLDGSVAELTGVSNLNDAEWQYTTLDMEYSSAASGDDSMAVVSVNNADGSIDPGATNVSLGSVEVQGVGAGTTSASVTIDSYQDQLEQEVDATVGNDSLTVEDGPGGEGDVQVSFADSTIEAGQTTDLSFELDEVPETGVNGVTLEIDLDGSVAELTGSSSLNDAEWQYTTLDMEYSSAASGDDSMAVVSVNNADGSIDPGATNVSLGSVEVQGVGAGTTGSNVTIDSYQDQLEQEVDATVGSDSLTVEDGPGGQAPSAPSSVTATATGESTIDVSWTSVSDATSYNVYVDGVLETSTSSTSTTVSGLSSDTTYEIGVAAENADGESDMTTDSATTEDGGGNNNGGYVHGEVDPSTTNASVGEQIGFNIQTNTDWIVEREWDMGDGTTYSGDWYVTHAYDSPGTYTVTLTTTSGEDPQDNHHDGSTTTHSVEINVS